MKCTNSNMQINKLNVYLKFFLIILLSLLFSFTVLTPAYSESLLFQKRAASRGDAEAQFALGYRYQRGQGVPQDYNRAIKWYSLSANNGNVNAQTNLGYLYAQDLGFQDYEKAAKWLGRAANKGDATAEVNLAYLYLVGGGVPRDFDEAARLYRSAADQGDKTAYRQLGIMYSNGYGTTIPKSNVAAYALLHLVRDHDKTLHKIVGGIKNSMSKEDMVTATTLSREISKVGNLSPLDHYLANKQ